MPERTRALSPTHSASIFHTPAMLLIGVICIVASLAARPMKSESRLRQQAAS
jgi:hypothetical protein